MKKKSKTALFSTLGVVAVLSTYLIVCLLGFFIPIIQMSAITAKSTDISGGNARYQEMASGENNVIKIGSLRLYRFQTEATKNKPFVLVVPGGGYVSVSMESEGYSIANKINELGYTAFVLDYSATFTDEDHTPLDALASAVNYLTEKSDIYEIEPVYALCGFSAGGNLIGLFGSRKVGYGVYDSQKPEALLMGYPWLKESNNNKGNIALYIYYSVLNKGGKKGFFGSDYKSANTDLLNVISSVDEGFTPCYIMHGTSDIIVPIDTGSYELIDKLNGLSIPCKLRECRGVPHGVGLGIGTSAEGWLEEAIAFWEEQREA